LLFMGEEYGETAPFPYFDEPQTTAHAAGPVLAVLRAADLEAVAVLYDLGDHPALALLPEPPPRAMARSKLLDSADPWTGREGELLPATATEGTPLILGPAVFCGHWSGVAGVRPAEAGCRAAGSAGREADAGDRR
jgi:hypothetical protein